MTHHTKIYNNIHISTVVYDAAKDAILASGRLGDGVPCHLAAALLAGVTATAVASPVDVVKTRSGTPAPAISCLDTVLVQYDVWCRYMNAPRGHYRGVLDCAAQTARAEGLAAFYRGFRASCLRLVRWG